MKMICTLLVLCHFGLVLTNDTINEITSKSPIEDPKCPENWQLLGDKCFRISNEEATFKQAVAKCEAENSILFEPQTPLENQQVYDLVVSEELDSCEYYIGITAQAGIYKYKSNGENVTEENLKNFGKRQGPNGNDALPCVAIKMKCGGESEKWLNAGCSKNLPFVCQQPIPTVTNFSTTSGTTTTSTTSVLLVITLLLTLQRL